MVTSSSFIDHVSPLLSGFTPANLQKRLVYLREHDLVAKGGRGSNAPDLTPLGAANIVLSWAAETAPSVPAFVKKTRVLRCFHDESGKIRARIAGEALAEILASTELAEQVESITIYRNFPGVVIKWENISKPTVFAVDDSYETGMLKDNIIIHGAVIAQISIDLKSDSPSLQETPWWLLED